MTTTLITTLEAQYSREFDFLSETRSHTGRSFVDGFKMMGDLIHFRLPNSEKDGLSETVIINIEKAFQPDSLGSVQALKLLSTELEAYLKKLIIAVDGNLNTVPKAPDNVIYLKELLTHLNIKHVSFVGNVLKNIRNYQTHNSTKLPLHEYYPDLRDIIFTYVIATLKRYDKLFTRLYPQYDFTEYLQNVQEEYNDRKAAFVDLEVKEYIEVLGKEIISHNDNSQKARIDTIINLRNNIPENQMMILGLAGMGKTTSLLNLASIDAKSISNGKKIPLPVYISFIYR